MKRFILALLLLGLLLSGCAAEAPVQEVTTLPTTAVTEPAPTLPVGLYDPDSSLEAETAGGVKVYPLGMRNVRDVRPIQNSLLILAGGDT